MKWKGGLLAILLLGLVALSLLGYQLLVGTTRGWFEKDLALRSALAVGAASQSLSENWDHEAALAETLADITRDERIMAAAACSPSGVLIAATPAYPKDFTCRTLLSRMQQDTGGSANSWSMTTDLATGPIQLNVVPMTVDEGSNGAVVLVHDLSYVSRREETTRRMMGVAFFVLSLTTAAVTLLAARFAWQKWTSELRRALEDHSSATVEFQPLMRDVRSLAERLSRENESAARDGAWTPARLRSTLTQYLRGERIVILANREPYIHERTENGIRTIHPASGLVTALEPVLQACSGVWVAHGNGSADRETVDEHDRVAVPPGEESYLIRRVWLTEEEENGYYYGFSNEGLWPLCHVADTRPTFRTEDWECYVQVNRRFADAVCDEVESDAPIILVQDYHFALVPQMLRARLPRATIIVFWHIPWPNAERIGICPWRERLIDGLLGASVVGFQTQQHCNNFIDSIDAYVESRIDRETNAIVQGSRRTLVRPYPISIEWPVRWLVGASSIEHAREQVQTELGLEPGTLIGVGVDRLDYTKGIEERLSAVDDMLARHEEFRGRFTFVQLAAPSRTKIDRYRDLNRRVEKLAEEINARWSTPTWRPIVLRLANHEPSTIFRYYRAARLCYVSSLHDGMNLVAKEFVAAHDDEQGVLILSQFTGAARDLSEALVVNPYDIRQAADAIAAALRMPAEEQRVRMSSMRRLVAEFNVYRWAGGMLVDAAELRRKDRLTGRLSNITAEEAATT